MPGLHQQSFTNLDDNYTCLPHSQAYVAKLRLLAAEILRQLSEIFIWAVCKLSEDIQMLTITHKKSPNEHRCGQCQNEISVRITEVLWFLKIICSTCYFSNTDCASDIWILKSQRVRHDWVTHTFTFVKGKCVLNKAFVSYWW